MKTRAGSAVVMLSIAFFLFSVPQVTHAGFDFFGGRIVKRFDVLSPPSGWETLFFVQGKSGGIGIDSIVWAKGSVQMCAPPMYVLGWGLSQNIFGYDVVVPIFGFCKA